VTNVRVLKRMCIQYHRFTLRPDDAGRVEAVRSELRRRPKASPDAVLELFSLDRHPGY
jgi:hypothetical protein